MSQENGVLFDVGDFVSQLHIKRLSAKLMTACELAYVVVKGLRKLREDDTHLLLKSCSDLAAFI